MLLPADLRQRLTTDFVSSLPPEIKREVLQLLEERRALAIRQSFIEWCRHCGFEPAAHHRLLISGLEKVARGERCGWRSSRRPARRNRLMPASCFRRGCWQAVTGTFLLPLTRSSSLRSGAGASGTSYRSTHLHRDTPRSRNIAKPTSCTMRSPSSGTGGRLKRQ